MQAAVNAAVNVWRFTDGKRGHENQTRGLVEALRRLVPLEETSVPLSACKGSLWNAVFRRFPAGEALPRPDLLLGAGRQTHWPLLAAKRATGAPAILLMRPAVWLQGRFDLCIVLEHDGASGPNVITTHGALTAVTPGGTHAPGRGVILIGGPSSHHSWDGADVVESVRRIAMATDSSVQWKLTTSRRTPTETTAALLKLSLENLEIWPAEKTDPEWVPTELAESAFAWVTEDSVSMVYEAITSGATTGILPVPRRRGNSRVIRGLDRLVELGHVSRLDKAFPVPAAPPRGMRLDEAARCAEIVIERFFPNLHAVQHENPSDTARTQCRRGRARHA
jgi:uncharacterized protein